MANPKVNLALIIKNSLEFLLTKQNPPPKFNNPEYDSYQDSDLWDLPSTQLLTLDNTPLNTDSQLQIEAKDTSFLEFLNVFDFTSAINQVLGQVGFDKAITEKWKFVKVVEEPEFGPGIAVKTVYVVGEFGSREGKLKDHCKWMSTKGCVDLLLEVKPCNERIGPLVVLGLLNDSLQIPKLNIPSSLRCQEYPPGVKLIPMRSRTAKPFNTTNLIVFVPGGTNDGFNGDDYFASGEALIVDPGCNSTMHKELEQIINELPRKLLVFVTHHHHDHVDGLSVVQRCNPDAILLAHENTFNRITKHDWSQKYLPIQGSEEICIGGQRLRLVSAPGHTDGHVALLHVTSNSLIVGDHCVGQGSALLDITSGGNMSNYFDTTYKFMKLSPHVLIPMHGRVNMWPKDMLCGYLKNRRTRESTILKAIEDGAKTLFDIVSYTYADVDRSLWIPAASNARLHVEHLSQQNKLPKDFSLENFNRSIADFSRSVGKL